MPFAFEWLSHEIFSTSLISNNSQNSVTIICSHQISIFTQHANRVSNCVTQIPLQMNCRIPHDIFEINFTFLCSFVRQYSIKLSNILVKSGQQKWLVKVHRLPTFESAPVPSVSAASSIVSNSFQLKLTFTNCGCMLLVIFLKLYAY